MHDSKKTHKRNWILSLQGVAPEIRFLKSATSQEELDLFETEEIAKAKAAGVRLTNMAPGGRGGGPGTHSEETKASMRLRKASIETREKMSAAQKGRPRSPEQRAKQSAAMTGRKASFEARENMSAAQKGRNKGKKRSNEARLVMSAAQRARQESEERVWVRNPTQAISRHVLLQELQGFLEAGWERGRMGWEGKKRSEEFCEKMREIGRGRTHTEETKQKLKSREVSPETRERMRSARLAYLASLKGPSAS